MNIYEDESQNIEYKESWNDKYLEWVCGFANAQGGRIFIGVNDAHEVVSVKDSKRLMEDIPNKIVTHLGIVADVNLHTADGLEYIEIVIEPSNIPIACKGIYHYRSGSTKQELRGTALQQFILKKMGRSWDDIPNDRAKLDDIDRKAIDYFLRKGIEAQRIPEDLREASTKDVLESLGLIDNDGFLNNAAILLFGKNPRRFFPSVAFKIGRFGKNEADLMYQDVIEGNIIQMADRVMEILQGKYLVSPVRFEGMQRYETLEIPKEALREILYNAIAHKDYTGPDIQMHVYDDHLEIWNEGELPLGYTEETLMGTHSSKPRNRNIANAMFKAGFIDTWGRGYMKIRDGFEAAGIPMPKVQNFCGGVQVSVQRTTFMKMTNVGNNVGNNVGYVSDIQLTDRQLKICRLIKEYPHISAKGLSEVLAVVSRTIERDLSELQKAGFIIREGSKIAGHWVLLKEITGTAISNSPITIGELSPELIDNAMTTAVHRNRCL
ncbi:MAG: ATP-binding protein [Bacteroides sp.]